MNVELFDLAYLPLTSNAAFLQATVDAVVEAYHRWMVRLKRTQNCRAICGPFTNGLMGLLPMSWPSTRMLFWSTRCDWTVVLDNGGGNFIGTAVSYLSREALHCAGIRVVWVPHIGVKEQRGSNGAVMLDVYGRCDGAFGLLRSITKSYETRWEFDTYGPPLPFERYADAELKRYWSKDLLIEYCRQLGLDIGDPGFFGNSGVLCEEQADWVNDVRVRTLKEARVEMRLNDTTDDGLD